MRDPGFGAVKRAVSKQINLVLTKHFTLRGVAAIPQGAPRYIMLDDIF